MTTTLREATHSCVQRGVLAMLGMAAMVLAACKDTSPGQEAPKLNVPSGVQAQLVFSNAEPAQGEEVVVLVRIQSGAAVRDIGSFTARITYDTTRLQFVREEALGDSAMRVVNPVDGEARVAGISTGGFAGGRLVALRFTALGTQATKDVAVRFDELHAVNREDLRRVVAGPRFVDQELAR